LSDRIGLVEFNKFLDGSLSRLPVHIKDKIEVIPGSITNPEAIDDAVENTDVIFHL
jgi:hypothetical protein